MAIRGKKDEVGIHGNVPRFEEPFGDVAAAAVSLAPAAQLCGLNVRLWSQSQLSDLHFKFGREDRDARQH